MLRLIWTALVGLFLLGGCGEATAVPTLPPASSAPAAPPTTATTPPTYPLSMPDLPEVDPYPPPVVTVPTDGYPVVEDVWVIKPSGVQCAGAERGGDLQTAVADLIALGIPVREQEIVQLIVCDACGCPTSTHFRVRIPADKLPAAQIHGWVVAEP